MTDFRRKITFENVRAIRDSGQALLCVIEGSLIWFPHSHIDGDSHVFQEGHEGKLVVSEWIANARGLL